MVNGINTQSGNNVLGGCVYIVYYYIRNAE